jgi:hypothetical protein
VLLDTRQHLIGFGSRNRAGIGEPGIWAPRAVPRPSCGLLPVPVPRSVPVSWLVSVPWPWRHRRPVSVPRASAPPASAAGASVARASAFRQPSRGRPLLSPWPLLCARPRGWPPTPRVRPRRRVRPWRRLPALEPRPPFVLPRLRPHFGPRDRRWRHLSKRGRVRCPDRKRGRAGSVLLPTHGLPRASRGSYDGSIRQAPV